MNTKFVLNQIQKVLDFHKINNWIFCGTSPDPGNPNKIRLFCKAHADDPDDLLLAVEHLLKQDPNWGVIFRVALDPDDHKEAADA